MSKTTCLNRISLTALGFTYNEEAKLWISDAQVIVLEDNYIFEEDIYITGHLIITGSVVAKNIFCKSFICKGKLKALSVISPDAALIYDNVFLDFLETDRLEAVRGIYIEKCNVKQRVCCNGPCVIKELDIDNSKFHISQHGLEFKNPNPTKKPE